MTCTTPGCHRRHHARGLCSACYRARFVRRPPRYRALDDPVIAAAVERFINDPREWPCDRFDNRREFA